MNKKLLTLLFCCLVAMPFALGVSPSHHFTLDSYDIEDELNSEIGSVFNAQLTNDAISGKSFSFDGDGDYIALPTSGERKTFSFWIKTNSTEESPIMGWGENPHDQGVRISLNSNGTIRMRVVGSLTTVTFVETTSAINDGEWHHIVGAYGSAPANFNQSFIWVDGYLEDTGTNFTRTLVHPSTYLKMYLGSFNDDGPVGYFDGFIDDYKQFFEGVQDPEVHELYSEHQDMRIEHLYASSSNDYTSPYTGDDVTPTFKFNTTAIGFCRISDVGDNYSVMGPSRDCEVTNGTSHSCTLDNGDALSNTSNFVYVACENDFGIQKINESVAVSVVTTNVDSTALVEGVTESSVGSDVQIFQNQQVYVRNAANTQLLTTVDVVAVYGNQRWLLNHVDSPDNALGLFNISPALHVLDLKDKNFTDIKSEVTGLIEGTLN